MDATAAAPGHRVRSLVAEFSAAIVGSKRALSELNRARHSRTISQSDCDIVRLSESWVVSELVKGRFNRGLSEQLYFWPSHVGQEVDIVVDHGTTLLPIECKSGRTLAADWFDAIDAWNTLAGDVGEPPVLVHGGDRSLIHRGTRALSWSDVDTLANEI